MDEISRVEFQGRRREVWKDRLGRKEEETEMHEGSKEGKEVAEWSKQ